MSQNTIRIASEKHAEYDTRHYIHIKGARSNNLKDIELVLPKQELIVVTGLSGSGKSSLIMDTLYAEGQRRYVESLSAYARQFLNRMKKPELDFIKGICPAIAIEQRVTGRNNRSTVGSMTEIYDYLRILYARIGRTYSPVSGQEVKRHQVSDVVDFIFSLENGTRVLLLIPFPELREGRTVEAELQLFMQKGYTRVWHEGELHELEALISEGIPKWIGQAGILVDRFSVTDEDKDNERRIADSVHTAFAESRGDCVVQIYGGEAHPFNNRFELDGISFPELTPRLFNYNNPYGACPKCEGYGKVMGIDERKVVPDPRKSIYDGALACWSGEKGGAWLELMVKYAHKVELPVHRAYQDLSAAEKRMVWKGTEHFKGINDYFAELEEKTYKIQNRVILARFRGRTACPECEGARLRKEALYVKVSDTPIGQLVGMPISDMLEWFRHIRLSDWEKEVAGRLILEINNRLEIMVKIGLGYLTLDRVSSSLSGGETQRIHLTRTLGSNLTNSLYILDEPSIGLHPKDTEKLVEVLKNLRDLGNTVIVVEHEEAIIRNADHIVDIGPFAGSHGGEVVFSGSYQKFLQDKSNSLTRAYMTGEMAIPIPKQTRVWKRKIEVKGARQHNLKNIDVTIPLEVLTVISGVSGSGKSTLVNHILYPALMNALDEYSGMKTGVFDALEGDLRSVDGIELIDQQSIGKSSRSNPVTYVKAFDAIRDMMASQQLARIRGYKAKDFSFNVEGGRCESCKGDGEITVEMQFLADVKLVCDDCKGRRFKQEILEVAFRGKNIYEILDMTIEDAIVFFNDQHEVVRKLKPLEDVGLGYVKLGQSSSTLSGGEAQRLKLASFLAKESMRERLLFIFDEPTTGLHFHDVGMLLNALNALVERGHTVVIVEHNLDVIKSADWLIDLGPVGGAEGGHLVFQGKPADIVQAKDSYTGQYLQGKF